MWLQIKVVKITATEKRLGFFFTVFSTSAKIMLFGYSIRKLIQKAIYLDKDYIEITHEYIYLGIGFDLHG